MSLELNGKLLLAGAGKMGGALLDGWIAAGLPADRVVVQDPSPPPEVATLLARHGIEVRTDPVATAEPPEVIVVAVKPQVMDAVFPPLAALAGRGTLVLSIAAGKTIASFAQQLAPGAAVIRAMPNTPAAIGKGITVCVANEGVSQAQRVLAGELMSAVGEVAWLDAEADMDAVTAVSGSGPAYVFLLAECLAAAGVDAGLDEALARRLAVATVAGSGALLGQSGLDAAELRRNVTSPGGTTAAALDVLMGEGGLEQLMTKAVLAAAARSRVLSG
jgi:pyrroline-5-carboxylate reductase